MQTRKLTRKQLISRIKFLEGVETYKPITFMRKVIGYPLIGYGVITLLAPTGSWFAIFGGCALVGIEPKVLIKTMKFYGRKLID